MARARNIKPNFFKNELLGVADPMINLLFISLWTLADKSGRLEDRPLRIKAETFPYRENVDVNGYLTELQRLEFICRYEVGGSRFIQIINFEKHQAPHKTEKESVIPSMEKMTIKTNGCALTVKQPLSDGELTEALLPDSLIPDSLIPDCLNDESTKKPSRNARVSAELKILLDAGISEQVANDFLVIRKAKRAPLTETALAGIKREADKAGWPLENAVKECVTRGWVGFNADWVNKPQQQSANGKPSYDDGQKRDYTQGAGLL